MVFCCRDATDYNKPNTVKISSTCVLYLYVCRIVCDGLSKCVRTESQLDFVIQSVRYIHSSAALSSF